MNEAQFYRSKVKPPGTLYLEKLLEELKNILAAMGVSSGVIQEQPSVAINIDAVAAVETDILDLAEADTRYVVRHLRLKCASPGANSVTIWLYEMVNDVLTVVDTFVIDAANFGTYHSLMDMFGLPCLAGDRLKITARATAGGPYAVTGQYSCAKTI